MPKQEERLILWQKAFSSVSRLEEKVNLADLSSRYELSGGSIMNIVRYCSLMALKRNSKIILLDDIIEGVKKELQKEGKTF
jgi:ATP-dependent 26S proteasome regulatory subunit